MISITLIRANKGNGHIVIIKGEEMDIVLPVEMVTTVIQFRNFIRLAQGV